ncbi:MAG: adenylyl-sulfate kinase [Candidatus Aureabacteria bacterium]|nr:adenylyl-sulfate kinase [Candidatus Auribacterota bacterium]
MNERIKEGFVLWFTGYPCSGKTTIADSLAVMLRNRGKSIERLDGDIVRKSLSKDLGFSREDRVENIRRIAFISKLLSRNGIGVITTFVSPYRFIRDMVRKDTTNFIEVFVDCPLEECRKRDVKGMYLLAEKGEIKNFTGISDPYEKPERPEVILHTDKETLQESCEKTIAYLKGNGNL